MALGRKLFSNRIRMPNDDISMRDRHKQIHNNFAKWITECLAWGHDDDRSASACLSVCLSVPLASLSFPLQITINSHFSLSLTLFGDKNIIEPTTNERTGWGTSTPLMSPISCLWLIDGLPSRHSFNGHCLYTISPERSWQARNGTATVRRRRPLRRRKSINFSVSALFTSFNLFNCF